jgi:putative endonuclease
MDFCVYMLQSELDQRFYFGQTTNVNQRLEKHNNGYSIYTRNFHPWKLFAYKEVNSRTEAVILVWLAKVMENTIPILK